MIKQLHKNIISCFLLLYASVASSQTDSIPQIKIDTSKAQEAKIDSASNTVKDTTQIIQPIVNSDSTKPAALVLVDTVKNVRASFDSLPVILKEGEIISKTLRILNKLDYEIVFTVAVTYPGGWRILNSNDREYKLAPGDSIFVPVRIIPLGKLKGNTKYLITAFVVEKDEAPVATASFYALRNKLSNWDLTVGPTEKIYFLNKSNEIRFNTSVLNLGNEDQELIYDLESIRKEVLLLDTNDRIIKKSVQNLKLKPNEDTAFYYNAKLVRGVRHYSLIDLESYLPSNNQEQQLFSLFARTTEPRSKGGRGNSKAKKLDFIKLGNELKVNPYKLSVFPVIVDANISNLFNGQPILNLNFRGSNQLKNGGLINYFSQYFFTNPFYSNQYFTGSYNYLGYYDEKLTIEIGDIGGLGGTFGGAGRGIVSTYSFWPEHRIGAFYNRSPRFFKKSTQDNYGLLYTFSPNFGNFSIGFSRSDQKTLRLISDRLSLNISPKLFTNHSLSLNAVLANHNSSLATNSFSKSGYQLGVGYAGNFLEKNRLRTNVNVNYSSKNFNAFSFGEMWNLFHGSAFKLNDSWTLQLMDNYFKREFSSTISNVRVPTTQTSINTLSASRRLNKNFITPAVFYNFNALDSTWFHSRGASFNFGNFDIETNRLISTSLLGGYTRQIGLRPARDYFFFQFAHIFRYRVFTANFRYSYGNVSALTSNFVQTINPPQNIGIGLNYQYQFKNPHFVLQNTATYSYLSRLERHNVGLSPELYYFTDNGWRIRLNLGYFYSRANAASSRVDLDGGNLTNVNVSDPGPSVNHSVVLNVGVRKEFGIPIPYAKKKYYNAEFVAFIDLNGNNKKDGDEFTLENVVIRLDDYEVLTNEKGKAMIRNIPQKKFKFLAFSLEDVNGFFPNISEEIDIDKEKTGENIVPVPFVHGTKLYGKVILDRDRIAKKTKLPVDLSGIKISAINGKTVHTLTDKDGSFSFYVPAGKYKIHLDEVVLGDKFKILQNDIELMLDRNTESIFITFNIIEPKRKIIKKKFSASGQLVSSDAGTTAASNQETDSLGNKKYAFEIDEEDKQYGVELLPDGTVAKDPSKDVWGATIVENVKLPPGIIYRVQLGAYQKPINQKLFNSIKPLSSEFTPQGRKYMAGLFNSYEDAETALEYVNSLEGYSDAFIVAYKDGKRVDLGEILKANKK